MSIGLDKLQDAIGTTLATIDGVARVTDWADADAPFPFLVIGEDEAVDNSTQFVTGQTVHAPVHVFSRAPGFAECKQIISAVITVLDGNLLTIAGHRVLVCRFRDQRVMRDPEAGVSHGIVTFEIEIEATA